MFKLKTGWMPPHTRVMVAKRIYRDFGVYNPAFGTAADYEWIVRVLSSNAATVSYFPQRTLSMLVGGASGATLAARLRANAMDGKAWADRSLTEAWLIRVSKRLRKVLQFSSVAAIRQDHGSWTRLSETIRCLVQESVWSG